MPAAKIKMRIGSIALFIWVGGCQMVARDRPLGIEVIDAETKKPVAGAQVKVTYPMSQTGVSLQQSTSTAGNDGIARMKVATTSDFGIILAASADGYLPADLNVSSASVDHIPSAGLFEKAETRPPSFRLEIYATPDFTVDLIVPLGYRGIVRARPKFEQSASFPPGQRKFRYEVSNAGAVELAGPPVLRQVLPVDYSAHFPDGGEMTKNPDDLSVGFKYWKMDGAEQLFVVGTKSEIDGYMRSTAGDSTESPGRGSGDKGGSKGGGRRRNGGGQSGGSSQAPPW
jgi:hypothetical protein